MSIHLLTHFLAKLKINSFFQQGRTRTFNKWDVSADRKLIQIFKKASLVLIVTALFFLLFTCA